MYKSDYYTAGAFIAAGAVFLVGSLRLGLEAPTSDGIPGAGFFPFILSVLVIVLGIAVMAKTALSKGEKTSSFALDAEQKDNARAWLVTVTAILGLLLSWRLLSGAEAIRSYAFEISAFAFSLFLNLYYKRSPLFALAFSIVMVALIHILFVRVLYIAFEI